MAKTSKDHLQDTFDDMGEEDLKRFKNKLRDRKEEPIIRRAKIDNAKDRLDLTDLMVNTFTLQGAVSVTLEILKIIGCNEQAKELEGLTKDEPTKGVEPPEHRRIPEHEFLNKHRDQLIQRVSSVMAIADGLRTKNMIQSEAYNNVRAAKTRQDKMRDLFDVLDSGGASVKAEFYRLLKENEPHLVDDLV